MQVHIAARARCEDMVRILNNKCVVLSGDELHEDPVAFECMSVGGVEDLCARTLTSRYRRENGAHEARLTSAGRTLENENGLACGEISLYELRHVLSECRVGFIQQRRIGEFFEGSARQPSMPSREAPVDRKRLLLYSPLSDDRE